MWSAGCLVEKPWPLESQKPTSKPWPIRLLVLLGIVFLRVAARRRLRVRRLLYEGMLYYFGVTRLRRPRRDAALLRLRVADVQR